MAATSTYSTVACVVFFGLIEGRKLVQPLVGNPGDADVRVA